MNHARKLKKMIRRKLVKPREDLNEAEIVTATVKNALEVHQEFHRSCERMELKDNTHHSFDWRSTDPSFELSVSVYSRRVEEQALVVDNWRGK